MDGERLACDSWWLDGDRSSVILDGWMVRGLPVIPGGWFVTGLHVIPGGWMITVLPVIPGGWMGHQYIEC